MSGGIVRLLAGTLSLLIINFKGYSQETIISSVRIMFYNVENLFDTSNDPDTEDDEFIASGSRRWNDRRYYAKLNSISQVIIAAGEWDPPAIVCLCEVENREVLTDLVNSSLLSGFNYEIIHQDSPDPRGIDVSLIFRRDILQKDHSEYLYPVNEVNEELRSREVLYSRFIRNTDTLHIFVNHWPSRRGGVLAGENTRFRFAEMVRSFADSINMQSGGGAKIIFTGDFNAVPDDDVIDSLIRPGKSGLKMFNLTRTIAEGSGTYRYQGVWQKIDQIMVSGRLLEENIGFKVDRNPVRIFSPSFLLMTDPVYPGLSPFPTFRGFNYLGGFSDHLPLILDLLWN